MSSNKPFIAARWELWWDTRFERMLRRFGWREQVIAYTGYASEQGARIQGRVVLTPSWSETNIGKAAEAFLKRRGWRNFVTAPTVHHRYEITFGDAHVSGSTDRGGYIDHRLRGHHEQPGWREATISLKDAGDYVAEVQVIADDVDFGIVSDVDDTILSTSLPRPLVAAWNSFFRIEAARMAVPGMAVLYDKLLDAHPGAPVVYVSTGAWNTQAFLRRFLERHRLPQGPMLLTDWGPTNTGWFRSGPQHKSQALLQLAIDFPNISWLLVGDDGQHDPELYAAFALDNPDRVRGILIRQLNATEQWLAHGTTESMSPAHTLPALPVPVVIAPDGRGLLADLPESLAS